MWLSLVLLFAVTLAWAKWTQSRRVYRALWFVAGGTLFLIGLAL